MTLYFGTCCGHNTHARTERTHTCHFIRARASWFCNFRDVSPRLYIYVYIKYTHACIMGYLRSFINYTHACNTNTCNFTHMRLPITTSWWRNSHACVKYKHVCLFTNVTRMRVYFNNYTHACIQTPVLSYTHAWRCKKRLHLCGCFLHICVAGFIHLCAFFYIYAITCMRVFLHVFWLFRTRMRGYRCTHACYVFYAYM